MCRSQAELKSKINDLTGSQWLFRSKSVINKNYGQGSFAHKIRRTNKACKPPELCRDIVEVFSHQNDLVFDPFAGTGGILIGAQMANRMALGLEINNSYITAYKDACYDINGLFGQIDCNAVRFGSFIDMGSEFCNNITYKIDDESVDFLFTDPPFFDMDSRKKSKRWHAEKGSLGRPMEEFGLKFESIDVWLDFISQFCRQGFRVVKPNKYMAVFMEDMFISGEYIFLTHLLATEAHKAGWMPQGEFIWYNEARRPGFFGYPSTFITNRTHTSILFFKKVMGSK